MRNLVEFPISAAEIIVCLERLSSDFRRANVERGEVGDMRSVLLAKAAHIIASIERPTKVALDAGERYMGFHSPEDGGPRQDINHALQAVIEALVEEGEP